MSPSRSDALPAAPIEPMLAKVAEALPAEGEFLFEPKWDGFRALVFRGARGEIAIQSRDLREFDRYFPDLHEALAERLPPRCVVDGEIVVVGAGGLDFDALQLRLHPAASRVAKLARETPASFVAFDLLGAAGRSLLQASQAERRAALEALLQDARPPLHLTPATRDRAVAEGWLQEFEGAGLDGVIAKPLHAAYQPGKRAMLKIKHQRTADCVVAGLRWHKSSAEGGPEAVGSLLLGLYDAAGRLHHVGITASFTMAPAPGAGAGAGAAAPRCARRSSLGRRGRRRRNARRRRAAAPARRRPAAGVPARTCPGCRCGPSGSARCATTTSRATASAMRRPSCAGGRTSRPGSAATTSSRWCRRTP